MKIPLLIALLFASCIGYAANQLLLFGGEKYRKFLGEFTGNPYSSDSIWNEVGNYGSVVSSDSIWNEVGSYGSEVSSESPFCRVALNPPKIVDSLGNFYGYLTINTAFPDRATFPLAMAIYDLHPLIRKDRYKWATKLNTYATAPIKRMTSRSHNYAPPPILANLLCRLEDGLFLNHRKRLSTAFFGNPRHKSTPRIANVRRGLFKRNPHGAQFADKIPS